MKPTIIELVIVVVGLSVELCACDQSNNIDESLNYITEECSQKLEQINSLGKFSTFMRNYRNVLRTVDLKSGDYASTRASSWSTWTAKKDKVALEKCLSIKEALLELEQIIEQRNKVGVCRAAFIDKLVEFQLTHLSPSDNSVSTSAKYIGRFFSLVAHQVSYICKTNLNERIRDAQSKHDCSSVVTRFLPPLTGENEQNNEIDRLKEFLSQFKQVDDFAALQDNQPDGQQFHLEMTISREALEKVAILKAECRLRRPLYRALFYPIAVLAQYGYAIKEFSTDSDDLENSDTKLLRCWLATAQLCQGVLMTRFDSSDKAKEEEEEDGASINKRLVHIKFGRLEDDSVSSQEASEDELLFQDADQPNFYQFEEISTYIVQVVKEKRAASLLGVGGKLKRKTLSVAKSFLERHVDVSDNFKQQKVEQFLNKIVVSDEEATSVDRPVAYNGKQNDSGFKNPIAMISENVDTFVQMSTFFIHSKLSLIASSIVALAMSAVFVWFSAYAIVTTFRAASKAENGAAGDNFKEDWRKLRDKRMKSLDDKVNRRRFVDKATVYNPT